MYGLHGMHGADAQQGSGAPGPADDANKQAIIAWWSSVPPEAQAPLVFDFLMANKDTSAFKGDAIWVGLTVQKIEEARKADPKGFVEVVEAAAKPDETMDTVGARFMMYGKAWLADKAAKAADAAKQPAPASNTTALVLGGAALVAAAYWFYGRKRGS